MTYEPYWNDGRLYLRRQDGTVLAEFTTPEGKRLAEFVAQACHEWPKAKKTIAELSRERFRLWKECTELDNENARLEKLVAEHELEAEEVY